MSGTAILELRKLTRTHGKGAAEVHALAVQISVRRVDVIHFEVEDRARVVEFALGGSVQHQADATAIEEREGRRRLKQELHAEHIAIERDRARQVFHHHGDLADG